VTQENFGHGVTDYRNPLLAEAMHVLGYVQRFGFGVPLARRHLRENRNPEPEFHFQPTYLAVTVRAAG
jgi:ATP-dependent DNA helicase RecG